LSLPAHFNDNGTPDLAIANSGDNTVTVLMLTANPNDSSYLSQHLA
jgi:hypothetical protein